MCRSHEQKYTGQGSPLFPISSGLPAVPPRCRNKRRGHGAKHGWTPQTIPYSRCREELGSLSLISVSAPGAANDMDKLSSEQCAEESERLEVRTTKYRDTTSCQLCSAIAARGRTVFYA